MAGDFASTKKPGFGRVFLWVVDFFEA